jgi:Ni,Fe-hydrogenase I small subunit
MTELIKIHYLYIACCTELIVTTTKQQITGILETCVSLKYHCIISNLIQIRLMLTYS